jgi:PleD family two-component response regulator
LQAFHAIGLLRRRATLHPHLAADLDANPGAAGATTAILVVDDERAVRGVVARVLHRRGYETAEAADAEAALSILGSEPRRFGLVITDDRMPGMSSACCRSRSTPRASSA